MKMLSVIKIQAIKGFKQSLISILLILHLFLDPQVEKLDQSSQKHLLVSAQRSITAVKRSVDEQEFGMNKRASDLFSSEHNRQQNNKQARLNESLISAAPTNCSNESLRESEEAQISQLLARHYKLESNFKGRVKPNSEAVNLDGYDRNEQRIQNDAKLPQLPRPSNVTVLIISWYPPILKLSWNLNELNEMDANKLDFYEKSAKNKSKIEEQFDLELALSLNPLDSSESLSEGSGAQKIKKPPDLLGDDLLVELRNRRSLIRKSLSCFQITYNIVNSRYKTIEEYPPCLRSIMLDRLAPATEYSLHVVAIYLGKYKLFSDRVQFVSPTDNESRRFREGTYRPIHRYPDESRQSDSRIGLALVRSEELTIVGIALVFWLATIYLFFNKWGKIRMLEPYQPAYREATSTTFHHPSIHNLPNSTDSPASGALVASLCGNLVGVAVPPDCQSNKSASGTPSGSVKKFPLCGQQLNAGLSEISRQRSSEGALNCRKASRSLMLKTRKHFDTMTDEPMGVSASRRTDAELSLLFQSKAQQLAKATSLWSHQREQQLKKLSRQSNQFRLNCELTAATAEFEILRRASQVSSLLRQRNLDSSLASARLTPTLDRVDSPLHFATRKSLDGDSRGGVALRDSWFNRGSSVSGHRAVDQQRPASSDTAGYLYDKQAAIKQHPEMRAGSRSGKMEAKSNKRRFMFMNKSHQHQHLATSTSSSTLINQPALINLERLNQSTLKTNSSSLDNDSAIRDQNPQNKPIVSSWSSLPGATKLKIEANNQRFGVRGQTNPIEHHILIEPPSPPLQQQNCMNLLSESMEQLAEAASSIESPDQEPSAQQLFSCYPDQDNRSVCSRALLTPDGRSSDIQPYNWRFPIEQQRRHSDILTRNAPDLSDDMEARLLFASEFGGSYVDNNTQSSALTAQLRQQHSLARLSAANHETATICQPEICFQEAPLNQCDTSTSDEACCSRGEDAFAKLASYKSRHNQLKHQSFCAKESPQPAPLASPSQPANRLHFGGSPFMPGACEICHQSGTDLEEGGGARARVGSVFVASPYSRAHRDSFAMLRALSQKKSKSAEDVAYLSSLVLQIWVRDRNPLLQSVSQQQLCNNNRRQSSNAQDRQPKQQRPKSSLNLL